MMMLGASEQASAGVVLSTGFESPTYTTGALAGQAGWSGSGGAVETSTVFAGTQAVAYDATGVSGQHINYLAVPSSGQGSLVQVAVEFYFSASSINVTWEALALFGENGFLAQLPILNGTAELGVANGTVGGVAVSPGAWHNYTMDLNFATGTESAFVDGSLIGSGAFANSATSLTRVGFGINSAGGLATSQGYADNLAIAAVPEPSSLALLGSALVALALLA